MIEMNNLPGEIAMSRRALIEVGIGGLFLVSSTTSFALQRLLVAMPFFDFFTVSFVARRMDTLGFAILDHLSVGMHYRLLPIGFIIIFNEVHHGFYRLIRQFALRVASSLVLGEQPDIPMTVLAHSVLPFLFPVAQRAIRFTQLLRCFAAPISLQEPVPLICLPIILRVCFASYS